MRMTKKSILVLALEITYVMAVEQPPEDSKTDCVDKLPAGYTTTYGSFCTWDCKKWARYGKCGQKWMKECGTKNTTIDIQDTCKLSCYNCGKGKECTDFPSWISGRVSRNTCEDYVNKGYCIDGVMQLGVGGGYGYGYPEKNCCACGKGGCSSDQVTCDNGRCITKSMVCDGYNNCGDYSDERNCAVEEFKDLSKYLQKSGAEGCGKAGTVRESECVSAANYLGYESSNGYEVVNYAHLPHGCFVGHEHTKWTYTYYNSNAGTTNAAFKSICNGPVQDDQDGKDA